MGRGRIVGILVAIAIGAVAVVEVTAPSWVSAGMESRIRDDTSGRLVVEAEVSGPPLVTPILATGRLDWLEVDIIEVAGSTVTPRPLATIWRMVSRLLPSSPRCTPPPFSLPRQSGQAAST